MSDDLRHYREILADNALERKHHAVTEARTAMLADLIGAVEVAELCITRMADPKDIRDLTAAVKQAWESRDAFTRAVFAKNTARGHAHAVRGEQV